MTGGIVRETRFWFGFGEVMTAWRCCLEVCDIAFAQLISLGLAAVLVTDRLASVFYWHKYRLWSKAKWSLFLTILALLYAVTQWSVHFRDSWRDAGRIVYTCGIEDTVTPEDSNALLTLQMVTSVGIIALNIWLWLALRKHKQKIHASPSTQLNSGEKARFERDMKTFKTITIVVVMHMLTHLGSRLLIFLVSAAADDKAKTLANRYGRSLVVVNAAVHFFILFGTRSQFRKAAQKLFRKVTTQGNGAVTEPR